MATSESYCIVVRIWGDQGADDKSVKVTTGTKTTVIAALDLDSDLLGAVTKGHHACGVIDAGEDLPISDLLHRARR